MKRYVLLAGVNGAGKSTLFSLISSLCEIEKINLDEGISFSQETTLCGKSILRNIQRAKLLGYSVEMHYIGVDSPDIAKERVRNRVMQGGHGISDEDIERRYVETLENLKVVLPQCDLAAIYDNTEGFRRFAIFKNGKCMRQSSRIPEWYQNVI